MPIKKNSILFFSLLKIHFLFGQDLNPIEKIVLDNQINNYEIRIVDLINTKNVVFLQKDKNVKIVFQKDSIIEVYNLIEFNRKSFIKKGTYLYSNGKFIRNGNFVFCDIKNKNDTIEISNFKAGLQSGPIVTFYSKNRVRLVGNFFNGKVVGKVTSFDSLGNLLRIEDYKRRMTKVFYFYSNGRLKFTGQFSKQNLLDSTSNSEGTSALFPTAKVRYTFFEVPIKIGKWKFYDINGELKYFKKYNLKGELKKINLYKHLQVFDQIE
jgi:hypothetical protein